MKVRDKRTSDKIELQMTPMIDIVFQLLVFFIMTFKIVSQEGDFNIKMRLAAPAAGTPDDLQLPPMKIRLEENGTGLLSNIMLNDSPIVFQTYEEGGVLKVDLSQLRAQIVGIIGDDRGPGTVQETAEIELDVDYGLNYQHVIETITAVSGYIDETDNVVKLVEKIKFAPPRSPTQ